MRRAQSVRHHTRPSLALATDDLGALKEADESIEDVLRRQLIDKDRENDKVRSVTHHPEYASHSLQVADAGAAASSAACTTATTRDNTRIGKGVQEPRAPPPRYSARERTLHGRNGEVRVACTVSQRHVMI
jgi:hypothetical protein